MALNFPSTPTLNEIYTDAEGRSWKWNGTAWEVQAAADINLSGTVVAQGQKSKIRFHWDTLADLQSEVDPSEWHGMVAHVHSENRLYYAHSGAWQAVANLSDTGGGGIALTDLSVVQNSASGTGTFAYDNTTGVFTYTPPTLPTVPTNVSAFTNDAGYVDSAGVTATLGASNLTSFADVTITTPSDGQVLKYSSGQWVNAADLTGAGGTGIALSDLSVSVNAAGSANLTYNNTTGVFAYTPPDLSTYLTAITSGDVTTALGFTPLAAETNDLTAAVTWANIPDANVPESAVTQHSAALSITESQISDLGTYLTSVGVLSNHTDVSATAPSTGQVLKWDGAQWAPGADLTGAGGGGIALTDLSVTQNTAAGGGTLTYNNTSGAFTYTPPDLSSYTTLNSFSVGAPGAASGTGSIAYNSSTGVFTYTPPKVQTEVLPAITKLTVTANGSSSYRFDQYSAADNPTVYAISGTTIAFDLAGAAGHPFLVQTSGGTNYDTGLIHIDTDNTETTGSAAQGKTSGVLYWKIPFTTTGNYRYQCSVHGAMTGTITIKDMSVL